LDTASCIDRFKKVYNQLGIKNPNIKNIDLWNLRGKSAPMDKLAPKLIRRAIKSNYVAIIIDPIYKVITGDENSADQMAHFCNQFDKIATELECSVIYCHHHSKGSQGDKKSTDRASGSGVFSRDADAIIDLLELDINDNTRKVIENIVVCRAIKKFMSTRVEDFESNLVGDEKNVATYMRMQAERLLGDKSYELSPIIFESIEKSSYITAWQLESTLREFKTPKKIKLFFDYPLHRIDREGILDESLPIGNVGLQAKTYKKKEVESKQTDVEAIYHENKFGDEPLTLATFAELCGKSERNVRRLIEKSNLTIENSIIKEKE